LDTQNRKLQQRVARRKEKVQRLIEEQEANLTTLDLMTDRPRQDYLRALSLARNKLHRLKQELSVLESGRLLGGG
jgi:hypothetical protein